MEQTKPPKRVASFYGLNPMKMPPPIGDRYLLEVFDFEEELLPSGLVLPPDDEERAGWVPAIVIRAGDGMKLDEAPHAFVFPSDMDRSATPEQKREMMVKSIGWACPTINEVAMIRQLPKHVPMVLQPGQEIIVEKYSGRKYRMAGRNFRTMAQVDCLQPTGRWFRWDDKDGWIERDLDAEQAAAEAEARSKAGNGKLHLL